MEARKGFKLIKELPEGEEVVAMINHEKLGFFCIATKKRIFKLPHGSQKLEQLEFLVKDGTAASEIG